MSFMFKPIDYDDWTAVNKPAISENVYQKTIIGLRNVTKKIAEECIQKITENNGHCILIIDGYVGAKFAEVIKPLTIYFEDNDVPFILIGMEELYKSQEEIDELTKECLPNNFVEDPVQLFGRLYEGTIKDFIDPQKLKLTLESLDNVKPGTVVIVYGIGSSIVELRSKADFKTYLDVTPKNAAVRAQKGRFANIGDKQARPFNLLMRRNYYVDFEIAVKLRKELLYSGSIVFYIIENKPFEFVLLELDALLEIFNSLANYPFRSKPVYLEGIWGGEFIRKVRQLPMDIADNIAWVFEFIPMEVSIVVEVQDILLEFPFSTFLQQCGKAIMGKECLERFGGYFPIRFNYDDTYHSNGNMSIQVHPPFDYMVNQYNEKGSQDEAYYIIATGHGAKTFLGFREDNDPKVFMQLIKAFENNGTTVDYEKYINALESKPGLQVMIPGGTVHGSGRNQFILELGSLSIGSYTFKLYDYNRRDKEGKLRPIHSLNGERVLDFNRTTSWVKKNLILTPALISQSCQYSEYLVGSTDLMYYQTYRIDIEKNGQYQGSNQGQFTVLTVVDGEEVLISSLKDERLNYRARFLDIIVVPASIDEYNITNLGYQPVVVHKTILKHN